MSSRKIETAFPLTPLQEGMLYHTVRNPESSIYRGQCVAELEGKMEDALFRAAWERLVRRHQALRSFLAWEGRDRPLQVVREHVDLPWKVLDWTSKGEQEQGFSWAELLEQDRREPFPLTRAPLMRLTLVHLGEERHRLLWSLHHALADGWSGRLVLKEMMEEYEGLEAGSPPDRLSPPSYALFVSWLASRDAEAAERYWREHLAGLRDATPLPAVAAASHGPERKTVELHLGREAMTGLLAAAARMRVTPSTIAVGAWAAVLSRYTAGVDEVTFGLTISERPTEIARVGESVGLYLNTVPLRVPAPGDAEISAWLSGIQSTVAEAREHSVGGLAQIARWSDLAPGGALVRSLVVYESFPPEVAPPAAHPSLHLASTEISVPSDLPLALLVNPGEELVLELEYDSGTYGSKEAMSLLEATARALEALTGPGPQRLAEIEPVPDAVRRQLIESWSGAGQTLPPVHDVLELFEAQVAASPGAPAVGDASTMLSYAELDDLANRLAHRIVREVPEADQLVAIPAEPGAPAIVSVLAALKAGRGYTFFDPEQPRARLDMVLGHVRRVVAASSDHRWGDLLLSGDGLEAEAATRPERVVAPQSIAYVVWTSGSTGEPKGVVVERGQLARSTAARLAYYPESPRSFLLLSPLSVDSSVAGLYWTLCTGGCLVFPASRGEQDPESLLALLERRAVTTTLLVPSLYGTLLDEVAPERLASLRTVVVAGEACPESLVAKHRRRLPHAALYNEYGPSEATVWATVADLMAEPVGSVTIGRPVPFARVYVLDEWDRPMPPGAAGELCIGGPTVARGYLDDAERTKERFVAHPFVPGERMYRTGDRARFLGDGRIEFLGRTDDQIKIRGFRVETGEIEAALNAHPEVTEAGVSLRAVGLARGRPEQLVAHVAPRASGLEPGALDEFLAGRLPVHMVPSRYVLVDGLPRTSAGKLDRTALASLAVPTESGGATEQIGPRTDEELVLAEIWKEVLGLDEVGVHDDFFEIGGDSLLSIRVLARAKRAGFAIKPESFFDGPTIAQMAAGGRGGDFEAADQGTVEGEAPLTPIQAWFFESITEGWNRWNQAQLLEAPASMTVETVEGAVAALVGHHDALRTRFVRTADGWLQHFPADVAEPLVRGVDLSNIPQSEWAVRIQAECNREHASLDVERGCLFRAVLFDGGNDYKRLLLLAHHLVVDAASWGIVLDDLAALLAGPASDLTVGLPSKTTSFRDWAIGLNKAAGDDLGAAAEHWLSGPRPEVWPDPEVMQEGGAFTNRVRDGESVAVVLDEGQTRELLEGTTARLDAPAEAMVLGAVLLAWRRVTGRSELHVDVEGHGRDALGALDVSRTVGWFTVATPLVLRLEADRPEEAVREVHGAFRRLPGGRSTFGLLRYLHPDAELHRRVRELLTAPVLFNYLSSVVDRHAGDGSFRPAAGSTGAARSPGAPRAYLIEINAWVERGCLRVQVEYPAGLRHLAGFGDLPDALRVALHDLARPASAGTFELSGLDEDGLSRVADLLAEIDGG